MIARRALFSVAACRGLHPVLRAGLSLLLALAMLTPASAQRLPPPDPDDGQTFRAIAFHDVRTDVRATFATAPEPTAVDETTLAEFFAWLQASDYHPVSLQQIIDARAGGAPLPPRAVLLTFDDGYVSTYEKAFPLLREFGYPAVVALVTEWMREPQGKPLVASGLQQAQLTARENFLSWDQVREMAASGLIEFASHSDGMHRGVPGNAQGNAQPAAATLAYDAQTGRYESAEAYADRVRQDLRRSRALIEAQTGVPVRVMVWPYGAYTETALALARDAGMPITFTLQEGANTPDVPLQTIRRGLATYDMTVPDHTLFRAPAGDGSIFPLNRAMHVDLDYVYDPDPAQQERNLSALLERVQAVGPRSVFLQAFADPDGDGAADALYFPNRHLPMRADLFNRVAWQLRTRTGVQVYAWMPVLAFRLPAGHPLAGRTVTHRAGVPHVDTPTPTAEGDVRYHRLTPFDPDVRAMIGDIYADLARHATFAGILFHDDALLGDDEDASPQALQTYAAWGLPADIAAIRADTAASARWAQAKTRYLTAFTQELAQRVAQWRPGLITARNLYARPVLAPETGAWFAQDYADALAAYDYVAVMAMPYMEDVSDPHAWLQSLVARAHATPGGIERTVFQIQARDWRTGQVVPDEELSRQWFTLHRAGARHLAYYPDDFILGQPGVPVLREALSVRGLLPGNVHGLDTPPALTLWPSQR